jgi:DNA-directed RNA polymerase subunit D
MKVKVSSASEHDASVVFSQTGYGFVNALRRAIINRVPTLAIADVEFRKQGSALYDEILAHRLGLIPLTTDYSSYEFEELEDENARSAKSMTTLMLSAKGPGTVCADQMVSRDPHVVAAQPKMPVVKLLEGQEVEFEARAVMGRGEVHAKHIPGIATYHENVTFTVKNEKPEKSVREKFPPQVFDGTKLDVSRITTPALIDAVDGIDPDVIVVNRPEDSFVFEVESFGQLTSKAMLVQGVRELIAMLESFEKEVKSL